MNDLKNIRKVMKCLPYKCVKALEMSSQNDLKSVNEIRLRIARPITVTISGKSYFLTEYGGFSEYKSMGIICTKDELSESFKAVCDYSVHSFRREISQGFITLEGGNRVGICGTAVANDSDFGTLKYISGLNFRIAGQVKGCSEKIYQKFFSESPEGLLIVGPPLSGKTTILKDLCRLLGEKYRVCVIDERSEIAAVYQGEPQNDIGTLTDVLDGYSKSDGINTAVRVMSPEIIICDEIGGKPDCQAIAESVNSGVNFVVSAHASSVSEIIKKENIGIILKCGIIKNVILLGTGVNTGKIIDSGKIGDIL